MERRKKILKNQVVKLLQVTDTHQFQDTNKRLLGINTHDSLLAVIDTLKQHHADADYLLLTGDLTQDFADVAYERQRKLFDDLAIPYSWIPGNHDKPLSDMSALLSDNSTCKKLIDFDAWKIILLDSKVNGRVFGYLTDAELEFLQKTLEQTRDNHVMICLHHHPIDIGSEWMQPIGLRNNAMLWDILNQFPQVKIIIWGHIHQEFNCHYNNVELFASPSTCIQFKPNSKNFTLDNLAPGYRWFELHADGSYKSGVVRVANYNQTPDLNSKGY